LRRAAAAVRETDVPVAFPTETVYGLGADAGRTAAVKAIFVAKGRPADNPLIVHVDGLGMLRGILRGQKVEGGQTDTADPIPPIYRPLVQRFWPGPLTIILPLPPASAAPSPLAPETTATLSTFGARMPRSLLALALIRASGRPLAAPSANASTRPSPTAAEHVVTDLRGKIALVLDGGPCAVGVESTVVDGLVSPPVVLRPGGVGLEELRGVPGWEDVKVGYKDRAERDEIKEGKGEQRKGPRAPGMKYRHYAPRAPVLLFEAGTPAPAAEDVAVRAAGASVGVIRTGTWPRAFGLDITAAEDLDTAAGTGAPVSGDAAAGPGAEASLRVYDVALGPDTSSVARGLFAALRALDECGTGAIYVEGIKEESGSGVAAAVMNRVRKAA
ncbi:DHBP synthase RibB-like alpha/beta domain-containing protein, partial [Lineolata rhizophorae]